MNVEDGVCVPHRDYRTRNINNNMITLISKLKKTVRALLVVLAVTAVDLHAAELRVNNKGGASYTTIQQAINAATSGDVIVVEGTDTPYTGDIIIDKCLKIIGPGYFLDENDIDGQSAKIAGNIIFNADSDGSVLAGIEQVDTRVPGQINTAGTGFTFPTTSNWHGPRVTIMEKADQITITGCKLFYININNNGGTGIKDIVIAKCWLSPGIIETQSLWSPPISITIKNCFLRNVSNSSLYDVIRLSNGGSSRVSITNNTFVGKFRIVDIPADSHVRNNLFFVEQNSLLKPTSTNYYYNIYNTVEFGGMGLLNRTDSHMDIRDNILDKTTFREDWFTCDGDNDLVDNYFTNTDHIKDKGAGMFGGEDPYELGGQYHDPDKSFVFAGGATQSVAMHCGDACKAVDTGPIYRNPNN